MSGAGTDAILGRLSELYRRVQQLERNQRSAQLDSASIEGGSLTINDDDGNPQIVLGLQPDGTFAHVALNAGPPQAPSDPVVGPYIMALLVVWDGNNADESAPLSDFAAVQVHCSTDPDFTPDDTTLQGTMTTAGTFVVGGLTAATEYYVALVTVNAAGAVSDPSDTISGTPTAVPDNIPQGSISALMLESGSISAEQLAEDAAILGTQIADQTVTGQQIAASTITGDLIAAGTIVANLIAAGAIVAGSIAAGAIDGQVINAPIINGGTITTADLIVSAGLGGVFIYSQGGLVTQILAPGTTSWRAPPGVTTVLCEVIAAGAGGQGGNTHTGGFAAGGAEYAAEPAAAVTPGHLYTGISVPAGAAGGAAGSLGSNGGNASITLDAVTITAHGGLANGQAGSGSANTVANQGGNGGPGVGLGGSGGGGSGGPNAQGNNGGSTGTNGGHGASAVAGGGPGGLGGDGGGGAAANGHAPVSGPGGGGGGGGQGAGGGGAGGSGGNGMIKITWSAATSSLIGSIAGQSGNDPVGGAAYPEGAAFDNLQVGVQETLQAASTPAGVSGGVQLYGAGSGASVELGKVAPSGLALNLSGAQADTSSHTVTGTTLANLSTSYSIPAGDAVASSTYRLICGWSGTQAATTGRTLQFGFFLNGAAVGISPTLTAGSTAAGDSFRWEVTAYVVCASAGSGGTWWGQMRGDVTDSTLNGTTGISVGAGCVTFSDANANAFAASTLIALPFVIKAAWGSTTGAPTITCTHTVFEKVC